MLTFEAPCHYCGLLVLLPNAALVRDSLGLRYYHAACRNESINIPRSPRTTRRRYKPVPIWDGPIPL